MSQIEQDSKSPKINTSSTSQFDISHQRSFQSLFPISTSIKDFGYPDSHPFKVGDFNIPNEYDGIEPEEELSDDEYNNDDEDNNEDYSNDYNDPKYDDDPNYSTDEINRKAIALFDFTPENDNEVGLYEGQIIWISYRHGQGWLIAEDPNTGENGLVPEEYVEIYYDDDHNVQEDVPKPFLPEILSYHESENNNKHTKKTFNHHGEDEDDEWVDTDYEEDHANEDAGHKEESDSTSKGYDLPDLLEGVTNISLSK